MSKSSENLSTSTGFQLHKSQLSILSDVLHKVIDYTEHKLLRYIKGVKDPQQRAALMELVERYKKGLVAISWKSGRPAWLAVTKES